MNMMQDDGEMNMITDMMQGDGEMNMISDMINTDGESVTVYMSEDGEM